jgi:L-ribulokinase
MKTSRSAQTCALGAAMAGAVAGRAHPNYASARKAMTAIKPRVFKPDPAAHQVYRRLFGLYGKLHDAFGVSSWRGNLHHVMKELIDIRNRARE